jgi:hypothetical protein
MQNWFAECGASMRAFWLEDQGQDRIYPPARVRRPGVGDFVPPRWRQHQIDLDHHQLAVGGGRRFRIVVARRLRSPDFR